MSFHYSKPGRLAKDEHDFTTLLEDASKDELQELIENEDKINEIICDLDKIKKIKLDKDLLQAENRSIADQNVSKEPILMQLREQLSAKYEKLKELNETFETNQAKLDSLHKDVNLETMLAVLQTTCAQTEEDAEELAENLFSGDLAVNEFITNFKAKRTLAHMRRIKMEKMRELVLDVQRNPTTSSTPAPTVPPRIANVTTNPTPAYPGSTRAPTQAAGSRPAQYRPPSQPQYPSNAFSQPTGQQYPAYNWR